jgi:hypothetical protein
MITNENKTPVKEYLDRLVDKDGLRTEVTVTLTDRTLLKTSLYLIATTLASTVLIYLVKNAINKTP